MAVRKKRGYSRAFTPRTDQRIKIDIDRVPAYLNRAVRNKARREGLSVRALTLHLWDAWVRGAVTLEVKTAEPEPTLPQP